ncbi:MAG: GNAT family N-acetyltransferase [Chloroflexi bacterium]|nr:GNAT family N-acetyltransferase [Chloroflexota bacterium]
MEQLNTPRGPVTLISRCTATEIEELRIDPGLGFFWHNRPDLQCQALIKIADQPEGRVALAHTDDGKIIGYVTITLPEADTRWGRNQIHGLKEMGGIEVSRAWRGAGVGRAILAAVFPPDSYTHEIVLATGYRWCWDVESSGLTVREYRAMLIRLFGEFGFQSYETDEPNIAWYPDNALVARVGARVSPQLLAAFKGLLFERPGSEFVNSEFLR